MDITKRNLKYLLASAAATFLLIFGVVSLGGATATATVDGNSNETTYWVNLYKDQFPNLQCYKHDQDQTSNAHGYEITIQPGDTNDAVVLNTFDPNWYGDKFVLLVVNAGNVDNVTTNPVAGTVYPSTLGDNGRYKTVSHWIVCKGFNGEGTTTTSSTSTSTSSTSTSTSSTSTSTSSTSTSTSSTSTSTSSTIPETTTSTVPETTTSTVPETTTSTVPETTSTVPETTVPQTVVLVPPTVVEQTPVAAKPHFTG